MAGNKVKSSLKRKTCEDTVDGNTVHKKAKYSLDLCQQTATNKKHCKTIVVTDNKRQSENASKHATNSTCTISANWKQLLQSGKVSVKKKKQSEPSKTSASADIKQSTQCVQQTSASTDKQPTQSSAIWFDDVDKILIEPQHLTSTTPTHNPLVKPHSFEGVTKVIAMDCEMVGVGEGGTESVLARVSVVNQYGNCIYDSFVKPPEKVTDYRTKVSGVRPADIADAKPFQTVQKEISDLLMGRILVGHALHNDFKVLFLTHPRRHTRDTAYYKPFRELFCGRVPSLKKLTKKILGVIIQEGEHSSVQDAQAAMRLYTLNRQKWESSLKKRSK